MSSRDDVIDKVVKVLRLAHAAGTEAEAHTALLLAQRMMFAHGICDDELREGDAGASIHDEVVEHTSGRVAWREYLAAVVAENFRCAYIISRSRAGGAVRLVFVGRGADATVAREAYQAASTAAQGLVERFAGTRAEAEREAARGSFLTGFIVGLFTRFEENVAAHALVVAGDPAVVAHATALTNDGDATGGALPRGDAEALGEGFASGYAHAAGGRKLPG